MKPVALVLAAHGSDDIPQVNERIADLCNRIGKTAGFDEWSPAFHQGEPHFSRVLDRLHTELVVIIPLMTSSGYYCDQVLPRELRRNRRFDGMEVHIAPPIGAHPDMARLIGQLTGDAVCANGVEPAGTTLVIIGHGTSRHSQSRITTERIAESLRSIDKFRQVLAAFLDESPRVEDVAGLAMGECIVAVPFMIGAGDHAMNDIPRRLGMNADASTTRFETGAGGKRIICTSPVGQSAQFHELVLRVARDHLEQARQSNHRTPTSVSRPVLRLGTRASRLALWQANHVADLLRLRGVDVEVVELSTSGDRSPAMPMEDLPSAAPFTDEIEDALRHGQIDLAVHAMKDLPTFMSPDFALAAVLPRGNPAESLVSTHGASLSDLPPGATVGTSSLRRRAQLLGLRPDLMPVSIRGAVDARARDVLAGRFDAAILASAGLERLGLLDARAHEFSIDEIVPAPGQAALVVQTRADDERVVSLVSMLDHAPTRSATEIEWRLLQHFDDRRDAVLAAYVRTTHDSAFSSSEPTFLLHARLMSPDGTWVRDVCLTAQPAAEALESTIIKLESVCPVSVGIEA